jgi:L-lactate dehydrogenase complex protein LldG
MVHKNQKSTTAKERMLKKIRQALLQKRDQPYATVEDQSLYPAYEDSLAVLFAQQLTQVKGQFVFCEDELQLVEQLVLLAEQEKWNQIYVWEKPIQRVLDSVGFPYMGTDEGLEGAEVGITGCEVLIARTGSVLVTNANASGRRLSVYPPVHIVVARSSQLVLDLEEALKLVDSRYGTTTPSLISVITGPSRTADIEKTLVLGAHGPKSLYVFLIDDQIC